MIYLIEQKPGEAMSFAGRFRLTGVVMVDEHDNRTLQLPFAKHPDRMRALFMGDLFAVRMAEQVSSRALKIESEHWARFTLQSLGGLAGVW